MTEKTWSFSINDEKKLDWQRLVADALAEGLDAFTVKLDSSDFTILFVRNTLLEKVTRHDKISLCNYLVYNCWGEERTPGLFKSKKGFEVKYRHYSDKLHYYRYIIIYSFNSEEIKTTLEALRNFKHETVVKVSSI